MRFKYVVFITLILLINNGCRDIQIKTIINNDGTITRTYIITQDIQIKKKAFTPFTQDMRLNEITRQIENSYLPMDSTWESTFTADTINKETTIKFVKTYKNIKKLQQDFEEKNYILKPLAPKVEVKRTFNWFNTINTYKESYSNIFKGKPYKEFFTEREIKKIRSGRINDKDSAQRKYYAWVAYAIVDEIIDIINKENDSVYNLNAWRKFMYDRISENTFSEPSKEQNPFMLPEIGSNRDDFDFSDTENLIASIRRYSDIKLPKEKQERVQKSLEKKMTIYMNLFTDNLLFSAQMPGKISKTNADSLKEKTAYWRMDPFIAGAPIEMVIKTKQTNAGIPITIGAILIAVFSFWILRKKKR